MEDEDDEARAVADGARVRRDHGCFRRLTWAVELDWAPAWPLAHARFVAAGWSEGSRLPGLWDLADARGHHVVVVPATGRVQLRLHYTLEPERRAPEALTLAGVVAGLLRDP